MSHNHNHNHTHGHESSDNINIAFWLNTVFAVIEIVGGLLTNSVAILSDALHDLGDSMSLGLSWYFQKKSQQKRDSSFSYGYKRFSLLGAFFNSVVLVIGSIVILQQSVRRLFDPPAPDAKGMLILALLGIVVNGVALLKLRKGATLNERVVSLHFFEDVLGWVAVLIGSIIMMFFNVPILDPVLSILISSYILLNVYKNLRSVFRIVLQGMPENVNEDEIRNKVASVPGVLGMHDIHAWSLDGQYNILTMHLKVTDNTTLEEMAKIKNEVRHRLRHLSLDHITIETENERSECGLENY